MFKQRRRISGEVVALRKASSGRAEDLIGYPAILRQLRQRGTRAFAAKRQATVTPVLDALAAIGQARRLADGRYAA